MLGYSLKGMKYLLRSYHCCVQREPWSDFYAMLFGSSVSAGLHQCLQILLIIIKSVCIVSKNLHGFKNQSFMYSFEIVCKGILVEGTNLQLLILYFCGTEMVFSPIKTFAGFRCYDPFSFNFICSTSNRSKTCHSLSLSPGDFWVCLEKPRAKILNKRCLNSSIGCSLHIQILM